MKVYFDEQIELITQHLKEIEGILAMPDMVICEDCEEENQQEVSDHTKYKTIFPFLPF